MSDTSMTSAGQATVDRPKLPDGYGVPETNEGTLPWSWAEERLVAALNYWIGTTRPNGRPHAVPSWGVWHGGKFYFDGSPETQRMKNIAKNPAVNVHIMNGEEIVIVEGNAEEVKSLDDALSAALVEGYSKYPNYTADPKNWEGGGLYALTPQVILAWHQFPTDMTRWRFKGE